MDVSFTHDFFIDGRFKHLKFTITEESQALLRNLGLLIRPYENGLSLFSSDISLLSTVSNQSFGIRIYMYSSDPNFINYTELPGYIPLSTVLYFNNQTNEHYLPPGTYVNEEHIALWSTGIFQIPNYDESKAYIFKDRLGKVLPQGTIQKLARHGDFMILNFDEGPIAIYEGDTKLLQLYYKPTTTWNKPLAVLDILPYSLRAVEENKDVPQISIPFKNRKTYWRYFLIDPTYQRFKHLKIVNDHKENQFSDPIEIEFQGQKGLRFQSLHPLPLQEDPDSHLKLVNMNDANTDVIKYLPTASPTLIYQDINESTESMYSNIYL